MPKKIEYPGGNKKACSVCKKIKIFSEFYTDKRKTHNLYAPCKRCHNKLLEKARSKNPKHILNNKVRFGLRLLLSGKNSKKWEPILGYTSENLRKHFEGKFDKKMRWGNYGSYWVVDHIKPLGLFKYSGTNSLNFKKCWALNNLQPLEKIANIKKSDKYPYLCQTKRR